MSEVKSNLEITPWPLDLEYQAIPSPLILTLSACAWHQEIFRSMWLSHNIESVRERHGTLEELADGLDAPDYQHPVLLLNKTLPTCSSNLSVSLLK